jgi:dihydroorotate dehydrogenase (fumarate)
MDLSTTYLGLHLSNPFMPGSSPMADELDWVKRLEDAGVGAIVMRSLFEEQITREQQGMVYHMEVTEASSAEALAYFPRPEEFAVGPDQYLEHIRRIKEAVRVPVIASLNGTTAEGWLDYARRIQQAGADAIELNVYFLATDPAETGLQAERRLLDAVATVRKAVAIPIAVKLSPFFSSLAHVVRQLDEARADGLVLFNRFYQPDIDIETLEVSPTLHLSDSSELPLRLRWLAILSGRVRASLAVSGGVHTAADAVKATMAGAHAIQVVSGLLRHGAGYIRNLREEMTVWMEKHDYESVKQMQGSMSLLKSPDPGAFERANYMRVLQSLRV